MNKMLLPLFLILFVACPWLQGDEVTSFLSPEEFVIIPWGHVPDDAEVIQTIRDCGFNIAGLVSAETLDALQVSNLQGIYYDASIHAQGEQLNLSDEEIKERVEKAVQTVSKHPALYGYYLRDEPGADDYPGLARWHEAFQKADPDKVAYINLFPNYASPDQMNVPTYEDYVEDYITLVKPTIVSYDHYALMEGGILRDSYFNNLEVIRAASQRHELPFWNIVLSNAHFTYAEPSPAGFRFQLYTTLAYGAKGICYFTYFTPEVGNYRLGPIDRYGKKTPTWEMLRDVNFQLHKIGPVYITLKNKNVFHYPNVPEGCKSMDSSLYLSTLAGGDFLVGEFEDPEGRPFALVVNKSLHQSCAFHVEFNRPGAVHCVNASRGNVHPWRGEHKWLAPGQGMLLGLFDDEK